MVQAPRFEVILTAGNGRFLRALDLNNLSQVSGQAGTRAAMWEASSGVRELPAMVEREEFGDHLADSGWVAGHGEAASATAGEYTAEIWDPQGGTAASGLTVNGWINGSWSRGVNTEGLAVGIYRDGAGGVGFFRWDPQGGFVDLDSLGLQGRASGIRVNNAGTIAASVIGADGVSIVLRQPDGLQQVVGQGVLGALGANGQVGGCSGDRPVIWPAPGAAPVELDPEGRRGCVVSLNAHGDAVGHYFQGTEQRAFLFQDGVFHDLQQLLSATSEQALGTVRAINDRGEILASAADGWESHPGLLLRPLEP